MNIDALKWLISNIIKYKGMDMGVIIINKLNNRLLPGHNNALLPVMDFLNMLVPQKDGLTAKEDIRKLNSQF